MKAMGGGEQGALLASMRHIDSNDYAAAAPPTGRENYCPHGCGPDAEGC